MSKLKIDASKWVNVPTERGDDYLADTVLCRGGNSEPGRSTKYLACGFCEAEHKVYIWSLAGSGKRCDNCGALMCNRTTFAEKGKVINYDN